MIFIGVIAVLAFISVIYVGFSLSTGKRRLSAQQRKTIEQLWERMLKLDDPVRRVMEADSIFDKALTEIGYQGSLGEKLKEAGPRFYNLDAVWAAHKLRNHLAHQPGNSVKQKEMETAVRVLKRAIESLF